MCGCFKNNNGMSLVKKNTKLLRSLAKLKNTTLNVLPLSPQVMLMYVLKHSVLWGSSVESIMSVNCVVNIHNTQYSLEA